MLLNNCKELKLLSYKSHKIFTYDNLFGLQTTPPSPSFLFFFFFLSFFLPFFICFSFFLQESSLSPLLFFFSSPFSFLSYPFSCWLPPPTPPLCFWLLSLSRILPHSPYASYLFFFPFFFSFCSPLGSTPQNPPPLPMFYGKVEKWVTFVGVWGTLCPPLFDFFFFYFIF